MKLNIDTLREWQDKTLDWKINRTKLRIEQYVEHFGLDKCYVGFSGGKDSTVLLNIARKCYPTIKGVFSNTGLEYPEIVDFVKTKENIDIIRPKMSFPQVIEKYGYPVPSKSVATSVSRFKNTNRWDQKIYRLFGIKRDGTIGHMGVIPKKWRKLINAPFDVSEKCCYWLKKRPFKQYQKRTGKVAPILGTMAEDSNQRRVNFLRKGCIRLDNEPRCLPMGFWRSNDVWKYIEKFNIEYCDIYDQGIHGTGCIYCMFGVHMEDEPNRFQKLKKTHPKLYRYCMEKLGIKEVLEYIGVPYK